MDREIYNEIILTDTIMTDDFKYRFQALFLPNDSYIIFKETNGVYETFLKIDIVNSISDPLCVMGYYEGTIKTQEHYNNIKNAIDTNTNKIKEMLNVSQSLASEIIESIFTGLENTMQYDIRDANNTLDASETEYLTRVKRKNIGDNEKSIYDAIFEYLNKKDDIELTELRERLIGALERGTQVRKIRALLQEYLTKKYGVILRKDVGGIYILDPIANGYSYKTHDDLIILLKQDFGANLVSDDDLKIALSYIGDRLEPQYNIVKFPNCIYDMEKMEIIEPNDPVFTLIESQYNYNPNAKSTVLKEFLETSLERPTKEETNEVIKGIKQIIGYFFTSGNNLNVFPILTGVGGGGKSVFTNILTAIFGTEKIADLSLQEMETNTHGTSSLANKHLNFIRDSDDTTIESDSFIKQLTGNEPIQVNPKNKPQYILPKEEVPKTMLICNTIPSFRTYKESLIERLVIIEFLIKFRGTDKQDPNLEKKILDDPQEIEWLIYESLEAYKEMTNNGEDFILRIDDIRTRELIDKHTNPINYLLQKVILKHDYEATKTELEFPTNNYTYVITDDLLAIIVELSKKYGVDVPLGNNPRKDKYKLMNAIKIEYDLIDGEVINVDGQDKVRPYKTETKKINGQSVRIYPNLIVTDEYKETLQILKGSE